MFRRKINKKDIGYPIPMFNTITSNYKVVATVLHEHIPLSATELYVKRGEYVYVLDDDYSGWVYVRKLKTKVSGYVPKSYLNILKPMNSPKIVSLTEKPATIAVVLYNFVSTEPDELTVKKGDKLIVLDAKDKHWLYVKLVSSVVKAKGYVPRQYVSILRPRY